MSRALFVEGLATVGYELASPPNETANQLRLSGRVNQSRTPSWLTTIELLAIAARKQDWSIDISKHYFVPDPLAEVVESGAEPINGTHVLVEWRIIVQAPNIAGHYGALAELIAKVQQPRSELMEVPLHAPPNRNALKNGKGAQGTMSAKVGPGYRGDGR